MAAFPLKYTRAVAKRAAKTYFWKRFTMPFWLVWLAGMPIALAVVVFWPREGVAPYFVGAVAFVISASAFFVVSRYFTLQKRAEAVRETSDQCTSSIALTDDGFRLTLGENVSTCPWSRIERTWAGEGYVVLAFNPFIYIHVPTEGLPDDLVQRLASKGRWQSAT